MCKSLGSAFLLFLSFTLFSCSCDGNTVTEPTGSVSITLGSATVTVTQGSGNTVVVNLTRSGGFEGTVALSMTGAPTGVTGTFAPASCPFGTSQSQLTLQAAASAPVGNHTLTIRATGSGVGEKTASLSLVVEAMPAYTLSGPASITVQQGQTGNGTITIGRTNFTGSISLSVSGAPNGLTASLSPSETTGTSSTLTLDATGDPAPGNYTLTVTGQAQGLANRTVQVGLVVEPRPSYTLSGPASLTVQQGQTVQGALTLSRTNFTGSVSFSASGAPAGLTVSFSPSETTGNSSTLTLDATGDPAPGNYTLSVTGQAQGLDNRTLQVGVVVEPRPSYTLTGPVSMSLQQGQTVEGTITITRTNFDGNVSLSVSGAPAGLAASLSPSETTGNSSTLHMDATGDPAPGNYTLTVTGQADGLANRTVDVPVTVVPAVQVDIQDPGDQDAVVGQSLTLSLMADGPAPLTFASVGANLPDGVTLDPGTGVISGTPSIDALLTGSPAGHWGGIVIRASSGAVSDDTAPFSIDVAGATLPTPYAYMPFDGWDLNDTFGRTGATFGFVTPNQPGAIGQAVRVTGTDSRIQYSTTLSSALNGKAGVTFVATISTLSTGSMFLGLAEATYEYSRLYGGLWNGQVEIGGRSSHWPADSYHGLIGFTPVNDGQFHTVMGVLDLAADRLRIYVDGRLDRFMAAGFAQNTFENLTPAQGNMVGHQTGYADTTLAPDILDDEVAFWDVVLDEYQAATLRWLILTGQSIRSWIGF